MRSVPASDKEGHAGDTKTLHRDKFGIEVAWRRPNNLGYGVGVSRLMSPFSWHCIFAVLSSHVLKKKNCGIIISRHMISQEEARRWSWRADESSLDGIKCRSWGKHWWAEIMTVRKLTLATTQDARENPRRFTTVRGQQTVIRRRCICSEYLLRKLLRGRKCTEFRVERVVWVQRRCFLVQTGQSVARFLVRSSRLWC